MVCDRPFLTPQLIRSHGGQRGSNYKALGMNLFQYRTLILISLFYISHAVRHRKSLDLKPAPIPLADLHDYEFAIEEDDDFSIIKEIPLSLLSVNATFINSTKLISKVATPDKEDVQTPKTLKINISQLVSSQQTIKTINGMFDDLTNEIMLASQHRVQFTVKSNTALKQLQHSFSHLQDTLPVLMYYLNTSFVILNVTLFKSIKVSRDKCIDLAESVMNAWSVMMNWKLDQDADWDNLFINKGVSDAEKIRLVNREVVIARMAFENGRREFLEEMKLLNSMMKSVVKACADLPDSLGRIWRSGQQ